MNLEYARIDLMSLLMREIDPTWFHLQNDCEYRDDYQCFFILKGSKTHTMINLKHGDIFD